MSPTLDTRTLQVKLLTQGCDPKAIHTTTFEARRLGFQNPSDVVVSMGFPYDVYTQGMGMANLPLQRFRDLYRRYPMDGISIRPLSGRVRASPGGCYFFLKGSQAHEEMSDVVQRNILALIEQGILE
jgi:hypothetical protein